MKEVKAIELKVKPKTHLGSHDDYYIMLNGVQWGELTFNLRGYVGYLPTPPEINLQKELPPGKLTIGEVSLAKYKQEIAKLNAEWKSYKATKERVAFKLGQCRTAALEAIELMAKM